MVQLARTHKSLKLAEYSKSATAGAGRQRFRNVLVCTEIALAFLLVAGSGLFLASLRQLQTVDPGFKSDSVLTGKVTLDATNYKNQDLKQANFIRDVTERVERAAGCCGGGCGVSGAVCELDASVGEFQDCGEADGAERSGAAWRQGMGDAGISGGDADSAAAGTMVQRGGPDRNRRRWR